MARIKVEMCPTCREKGKLTVMYCGFTSVPFLQPYAIWCDSCRTHGPIRIGLKRAIKAWNRRSKHGHTGKD